MSINKKKQKKRAMRIAKGSHLISRPQGVRSWKVMQTGHGRAMELEPRKQAPPAASIICLQMDDLVYDATTYTLALGLQTGIGVAGLIGEDALRLSRAKGLLREVMEGA